MSLARRTLRTFARQIPWLALALVPLACGGAPGDQSAAPMAPSSVASTTPMAAPGLAGTSVRNDEGPRPADNDDKVEIEGRIESIDRSSRTFEIRDRTVSVTDDTVIRRGSFPRSFDDLGVGDRVHVRGTLEGDRVIATRIEMQNVDEGREVELEGEVSDLEGSCPDRVFKFGSQRIVTDRRTVFARGKCEDLANGQDVEVDGFLMGNGSVHALKVKLSERPQPPGEGDEDDEIEIEGSIGNLGGSCPNLTFRVRGERIVTNGSTTFESAACGVLRNGQKVEVEGTRQSGGAVLASKVKRR